MQKVQVVKRFALCSFSSQCPPSFLMIILANLELSFRRDRSSSQSESVSCRLAPTHHSSECPCTAQRHSCNASNWSPAASDGHTQLWTAFLPPKAVPELGTFTGSRQGLSERIKSTSITHWTQGKLQVWTAKRSAPPPSPPGPNFPSLVLLETTPLPHDRNETNSPPQKAFFSTTSWLAPATAVKMYILGNFLYSMRTHPSPSQRACANHNNPLQSLSSSSTPSPSSPKTASSRAVRPSSISPSVYPHWSTSGCARRTVQLMTSRNSQPVPVLLRPSFRSEHRCEC